MTVRCGNHGRSAHVYHADAAEVRACYAGRLQYDETTTLFNDDLDPPGERQHRRATFDGDAEHDATFAAIERQQEQAAFEAKQARDRKLADDGWTKTKLTLDHVPEGGYAVEGEDGKLRFLEVDRPDEGKWNGFIFVKIRASDERHKLGTQNPRYGTYAGKGVALVTVLAGADTHELNERRIRFGKEIQECGFCRRSLTDEDSRELGYGPVCAGRNGLYHPRARAS